VHSTIENRNYKMKRAGRPEKRMQNQHTTTKSSERNRMKRSTGSAERWQRVRGSARSLDLREEHTRDQTRAGSQARPLPRAGSLLLFIELGGMRLSGAIRRIGLMFLSWRTESLGFRVFEGGAVSGIAWRPRPELFGKNVLCFCMRGRRLLYVIARRFA
jgi:hypothetical protein